MQLYWHCTLCTVNLQYSCLQMHVTTASQSLCYITSWTICNYVSLWILTVHKVGLVQRSTWRLVASLTMEVYPRGALGGRPLQSPHLGFCIIKNCVQSWAEYECEWAIRRNSLLGGRLVPGKFLTFRQTHTLKLTKFYAQVDSYSRMPQK